MDNDNPTSIYCLIFKPTTFRNTKKLAVDEPVVFISRFTGLNSRLQSIFSQIFGSFFFYRLDQPSPHYRGGNVKK